jgi:hypothetical protein
VTPETGVQPSVEAGAAHRTLDERAMRIVLATLKGVRC